MKKILFLLLFAACFFNISAQNIPAIKAKINDNYRTRTANDVGISSADHRAVSNALVGAMDTIKAKLDSSATSQNARSTNIEQVLPLKRNTTTPIPITDISGVTAIRSVTGTGTVNNPFKLDGDAMYAVVPPNKFYSTDVDGYRGWYDLPHDATKANASDVGKASANYYYVNKRTDVTTAVQDAAAMRGNMVLAFRNIYMARNQAVTDIRNGVVTSAVVYVFYGNTVSVGEDTITVTAVDYKIPVGINGYKFYANYDSDSTSMRTSNLGFKNLFYIFENNCKVSDYCSSQSRLADDAINSNVGMSNFGFQNLNYESFYGQNYDGSENKKSGVLTINAKSKNVVLKFNDFICRRAVTPLGGGGDPLFEVLGKYWTKTLQCEYNTDDTAYAIRNVNLNDYRVGGDFTNDTTFSVNDNWGGYRIYAMKNATYNYKINSVKYADASTNFIGVYALYGRMILNSTLNFKINHFEQRYQRAFNHLNNSGMALNSSILGFGGVQNVNKYNVNFDFGYIKSEMPFIKQFWGGTTDSVNYSINVDNSEFDCTYGGSTMLSTNYVINLSMINLTSVMRIKGNYACKGYAGLINVTGGSGTIIFDGVFKTLDDKPVITVTSGFTGKLIVNGQLIVGRDVATPTAASIAGTGIAIIQSAISNKAATATTLGNAIAVNTAFK
jgi:hypothetical protein